MTEILVRNDELLTVREAMREMNRHVGDLGVGRKEKLVLTQRNRMCAVVISAERYTELANAERELAELRQSLGSGAQQGATGTAGRRLAA